MYQLKLYEYETANIIYKQIAKLNVNNLIFDKIQYDVENCV